MADVVARCSLQEPSKRSWGIMRPQYDGGMTPERLGQFVRNFVRLPILHQPLGFALVRRGTNPPPKTRSSSNLQYRLELVVLDAHVD